MHKFEDTYVDIFLYFQYVLSVLGFTYPTIYQGWQTFLGVIILKILLYKSKKYKKVTLTPLDKAGFISLLPSFLFYVAGIVASSKALTFMVCTVISNQIAR